jgi:hypothetical protein
MHLLYSEEIVNLFLVVKKIGEKFLRVLLAAVTIDYLRYFFSIQMTNRCAFCVINLTVQRQHSRVYYIFSLLK